MNYIKKKLVLVILVINLYGCDFKRFDQEKYVCNSNSLDIDVIDVIQTSSIKKGFVTISGKEYFAEIKSLNKDQIILFIDNINIRINKNSQEITATFQEKIYFLKWK